jgi:glycosyltransferase involved in cell wall biosynthesis
MQWRGLRLGLVGPLPPPAGGMANQTLQLAELLRGEGVAVTLVPTNAPYFPSVVGRIRGARALFRLVPYLARLWHMTARVDVVHIMANSGWSWHLFAAPAVWIASLRGVPAVVNYRGGEAELFLTRSAMSVRRTLTRAAALVVPSGFLQGVFARFQLRAEVVPNIIDPVRFYPGPTPVLARAPHVVVTRNLEPLYDIPTALRAFQGVLQTVPGARMTIAGSGPDRERLESLAEALGISAAVRFAGPLDREEIAELYHSASVALNPSRVDNMPTSVLEALASGVPVVSTRAGGVPFVVKDGTTALLVDVGDDRAITAAVLRLAREPSLAESLVQAGIREAQRYTWPRVGHAWFLVYERAITRDSAAERAA